MLKGVRVAFVAGLLAAAAYPVTFNIDALAQGGSSGGSGAGGSGSGATSGAGAGGSGSSGSRMEGANTGDSRAGTPDSGKKTGSGTTGAGSGGTGAVRGSGAATSGTPVNRNDAANPQRPAPSSPAARVNSLDYVNAVGSSDMFEVASSQLALERSSNPRVQEFARKMVADHQQASQRLHQVLSTSDSNLRAPARMSPEHQRMLERLRGAKRGAEFDRMYLDMQVRGHERALAFHRSYANTGDNTALQGVARELAPVVQQHLTQVRQIAGSERGENRRQGSREKREGS